MCHVSVFMFSCKQKTAYEMRISDWSSDVCASDLQVSLLVGLAAALCAAVIGTLLGLAAGYYGGRLDALLMRFADGVIALPILPLLIILAAVDLGKLGLPQALVASESVSLYRIVLLIAIGSANV